MDTIFAGELDNYRDNEHYIIVDVRDPSDYNTAHLKGAVNLPSDEIENKFPPLDPDKIYILYCDKGTVSLTIARDFEHRGFHAMSVIGGIASYRGELEQS
ncbi:MAG: rhodanese-like domain-containing protein [bacterium]|nr:rhodanese-like domain-containing protein [bacterium]